MTFKEYIKSKGLWVSIFSIVIVAVVIVLFYPQTPETAGPDKTKNNATTSEEKTREGRGRSSLNFDSTDINKFFSTSTENVEKKDLAEGNKNIKEKESQTNFVNNFLNIFKKLSPNQNKSEEKSELKEYGNNVALVIRQDPVAFYENINTLNEFIKNPEKEEVEKKIKEMAIQYDLFSEGLKKINPPKESAEIHNKYINDLENLSEATRNLTQYSTSTDYKIIEEYNNKSMELSSTLLDLVNLFKEKGIVFDQNDPGNIFSMSLNLNPFKGGNP